MSRRGIVAVRGDGALTPVGRLKPGCNSTHDGKQCAYIAGHDGYHCDKNGLTTWESDTKHGAS